MTASAPAAEPAGSLTFRPAVPIDLRFALMGVKTVRSHRGVRWWSTSTPSGPATVAFRVAQGAIRVDSWGPGTNWALTQFPALVGARDDPSDFRTDHALIGRLAERFESVRIGATGRWYEALATAAIGQRVVTADAAASRRRLAFTHGPGSLGGPVPIFPTAETILTLSDHQFHRAGIERSRARVLRIAAKYADRLERLADIGGADASAWLRQLPGVGPWTAALTTAVAGGDPDAVPVGDLHIPRMVTFALSGEENGDDQRMLELLEPFAGHRQRVVRLIKMSEAGGPNHRPSPFRFDISRF